MAEPIELVELTSFKTLQVEGPDYQMDLEEDAWSYGAPPPKGVYEFKWYPVKEGAYKSGYGKKGDASSFFVQVTIEGHLVNNSEWDGSFAQAYLSSRVGRGKTVSQLVGFLIAGGQKGLIDKLQKQHKNNPKTQGEIAELLLKKEPVIRAEIDWRGAYSMKDPKGGEKDVWVNVANKYEEFPLDPEDKTKRVHIYTTTGKDGLPKEIRAQVRVTRFLQKGEVYNPGKSVTVGAGGVVAPILIQAELEPELVVAASAPVVPTLVSQPVVVSQPPIPPAGDDADSVELMLAES